MVYQYIWNKSEMQPGKIAIAFIKTLLSEYLMNMTWTELGGTC